MNEAKEKDLGTYKKSTLKTEKITRGLFLNDEITLIYFQNIQKELSKRFLCLMLKTKK